MCRTVCLILHAVHGLHAGLSTSHIKSSSNHFPNHLYLCSPFLDEANTRPATTDTPTDRAAAVSRGLEVRRVRSLRSGRLLKAGLGWSCAPACVAMASQDLSTKAPRSTPQTSRVGRQLGGGEGGGGEGRRT